MAAEGAIYRAFADNPSKHIINTAPQIMAANIGIDFGGHGSAHSFTLTGYTAGFETVIILDEWYHKGELTPQELETAFIDFVQRNSAKYPIRDAYCDSAETTLIKGLDRAARREHLRANVMKSLKKPIKDRINCEVRLFASGRLKIMEHCEHHIEAFSCALWDSKHITEDVRLDNGSTPIDPLDSFEYSFERDISYLIDSEAWRR